MKTVPVVVSIALLTFTGCAFLLWNTLNGLAPNPVLLGVTLAFATVLLVLPWTLGIFRPAGVGHPCDACGRPVSGSVPVQMRTGFCLYCGEFTSRSVATWYARRT